MTSLILSGTVQSGDRNGVLPIAGARVTLYAATDDTPVELGVTTTNGAGAFSLQYSAYTNYGIYYATASFPDGVFLFTIIGAELPATITINELTTVAAAFSMAQFATPATSIAGNAQTLRIAAGMSHNLVSPLTGEPSAVMLSPPNADQTNALRSLRNLANLLAPAVRGVPGAWSTLQSLAWPPHGGQPANSFQAMVNIARYPGWKVAAIYQQSQAMEVYTPSLAVPPDAWTLAVKVNRTGDDGLRKFGGPANISWDANGNAWIANNVFQGTPNSGDFVVVLKPNGMPADGTENTPVSPVVGGGMVGPGFGISVGRDGNVWVGSFGWGPKETFPTAGIVSRFDLRGKPYTPDGYTQGTVRVQGVYADKWHNIWCASYGDDTVAVYPRGEPDDCVVYPRPGTNETVPGSCTFGIAVDERAEVSTAWVTYSGGLGWPEANPGHVARFELGEDRVLRRTLALQVGSVTKGIGLDRHGNAWIASGGDDSVYLVTPEGQVTGFSNRGGMSGPWSVAVDGDGDVWVANFGRMGITQDYTRAGISRIAGVDSPSGLPVGEPISPETGYTLPTAGEPVTLPGGSPLYEDGTPCYSPLMRMTSVTIDRAGNIWAVNNWKPRFGTDFEPEHGNPGGDGIVIFVGVAKPPEVVI